MTGSLRLHSSAIWRIARTPGVLIGKGEAYGSIWKQRISQRIRLSKYLVGLLLAIIIFTPCQVYALCAAQDMEGKWINENPDSRNLHRIDIHFPCYDTAGSSGPAATIHVYGVCEPSPCDWGEVPASSTFLSLENNWPQYTRVGARYQFPHANQEIEVLKLSPERLIVFSGTHFTVDNPEYVDDYSRIEYFKPMNRYIDLQAHPDNPKQGDILSFWLNVGDQSSLTRIDYTINGTIGIIQTPPYTITFDTCKNSGQYYTNISLLGEAVYSDGERVPFSYSNDLTTGKQIREDQDRTFAFYVAEDDDQDLEDRNIDRANAFIDEFNSYNESQYFFAEPWFYTTNAIDFANSVDLAISIGHGNHHIFFAGNTDVDLSTTEFGNFVPCHRTGDLEYLAFVSCETLSDTTIGSTPFWDFWIHNNSNRLDPRPFSGLHMVLGFLNDVHFRHWFADDNGSDFLSAFAEKLDDGMKVRTAWLEAADDELPIDSSQNRAGVLYLEEYEHDRLSTVRDDFIYGNPKYGRMWLESY